MKRFNQKKTIEKIEKYIARSEKETASQPYKPFFTIYAKKRHKLNPLKYILGEYKMNYFEKGRQPKRYVNSFELFLQKIDLDIKDIVFDNSTSQ